MPKVQVKKWDETINAVPCSYCFAQKGKPCKTLKQRTAETPHMDRIKDATLLKEREANRKPIKRVRLTSGSL